METWLITVGAWLPIFWFTTSTQPSTQSLSSLATFPFPNLSKVTECTSFKYISPMSSSKSSDLLSSLFRLEVLSANRSFFINGWISACFKPSWLCRLEVTVLAEALLTVSQTVSKGGDSGSSLCLSESVPLDSLSPTMTTRRGIFPPLVISDLLLSSSPSKALLMRTPSSICLLSGLWW